MRLTALVLGVVGGVVGIWSSNSQLQAAVQLNWLNRLIGTTIFERSLGTSINALVGAAALATVLSILGVVGGGLVMARPRTAAILMIVAAIGGVVLLRAAYVLPAAILVSGAILATISRGPVARAIPAAPSVTGAPPDKIPNVPDRVPNVLPTALPSAATPRLFFRIAWAAALVLTLSTWWFWVLALFASLALGAVAWIPRFGEFMLQVIGWSYLPAIGRLKGWRASGILLLMAVAVLFVGVTIAPPTPK